jgi:tetratricopeptide (TPR) repeat protein
VIRPPALSVLFLAALTAAVAAQPDQDRDPVAHLRSLRERGAYREAEALVRGWMRTAPSRWGVPLGELLVLQGGLDDAERLFREAAAAPGGLVPAVRLGQLLELRGDREGSRRVLRGAVEVYQQGRARTSAELAAAGDALRILGATDPPRVREALRAYDRAIASDSGNVEARVSLGDLFLEKHNRPDATATFDAILAINPRHPEALLGKARVGLADGTPEALGLLRQSLEGNPNLVPARVALAASQLDREAWNEADAEAGRALAVNPASVPALTVRAAARLLGGDTAGFERARQEVLAINPRPAAFYAELAEVSARNRYYQEATDLAARGVALDSVSSGALGALGLNQLRVGAMAEGRRSLERAFALDPFNVWYKNTLDLLDQLATYRETGSARFRFLVVPEEAVLLQPYLAELAEAAYDQLATRYRFRPPPPIRVELYRHHADFSVRTVGLAGFGALGVSFGPVVAMDAPSARPRGTFNWGSTLWHELAHTFTLGMTAHRVPRWFSEGLSVLEERRARPGWGAQVGLGFLRAWQDGRLPPVSRLNDGFVRPAYPEQVAHAYYLASMVCEMIETTRGMPAILAILAGYRNGRATPEIFRSGLGVEPEAFDREFADWLRTRFGRELAAIGKNGDGEFQRELRAGTTSLGTGATDQAIVHFERAQALFPDYAEPGSPSLQLARIHEQRGDLRRAAAEVARHTGLAESDYEANLLEADLRERLNDRAGAASALERAVYIDPRDPALHERLANLFGRVGEWKRAVRERQAVVALDPVDRAEAYYQLAQAMYRAGDLAAARREVLRALELAPAFEKAQDLLLQIRDGPPRPGGPDATSR